MLARLNEESFRYVLNTFGPKGYEYWRSRIGGQPLVIPDPFVKEQQLEIIAMRDRTLDETIRVFVFAMRDMAVGDLIAQFKRNRPRDSDEFFVFKDGRTEPEFDPPTR